MLEAHGADGDWGGETSAALELFQHERGIFEDGCGPKTWAALIGT
jgi:peptidoglycan hydrolase-like protein with peptidoglycan-binding domain